MKINIYYGGRGMVGDSTLFVLSKMQKVLEELNVHVERINLYEEKHKITSLPSTLKDADGVILATTVEWYGIGGYMSQFLDACWFYGNKQKISELYMCPVVISTTYGERQGAVTLQTAWDTLGGRTCNGMSAYVRDSVAFELNQEYVKVIERTAENLYRTVSRKGVILPASSQAVKQMVTTEAPIDLTPQETEQLSRYASDDKYIQTQKEDLKELASHFKTLLKNDGMSEEEVLIKAFQDVFKPQESFESVYLMEISGFSEPLAIEVSDGKLTAAFEKRSDQSVLLKIDRQKLDEITSGTVTFQHAFMSGDMQVKGDFRLLRMLDTVFPFLRS